MSEPKPLSDEPEPAVSPSFLQIRAGTGLYYTGSGRARALRLGLGSGSGLTIFGLEPVGLSKIRFLSLSGLGNMHFNFV